MLLAGLEELLALLGLLTLLDVLAGNLLTLLRDLLLAERLGRLLSVLLRDTVNGGDVSFLLLALLGNLLALLRDRLLLLAKLAGLLGRLLLQRLTLCDALLTRLAVHGRDVASLVLALKLRLPRGYRTLLLLLMVVAGETCCSCSGADTSANAGGGTSTHALTSTNALLARDTSLLLLANGTSSLLSSTSAVTPTSERVIRGVPRRLLSRRGAIATTPNNPDNLGRAVTCQLERTLFAYRSPESGAASIFFTTSHPPTTRPNTTCLPLRNSASASVMKNWHPFVLGPWFAWPLV